jgi:hypothetical protein
MSKLHSTLSPYLPCVCWRVLRFPSSRSCVKSSDCRTIGRSPGSIRRGKCWESVLAYAVLGEGTVGTRSVFDWALSCGFHKLHPDHTVGAWGLLAPQGGGRLRVFNKSCVFVRWLHPSSQTCWEFLPANPYLANWGGWGYRRVLMQFVLGQGPHLQCPCNSLLWPGFPFSPSG